MEKTFEISGIDIKSFPFPLLIYFLELKVPKSFESILRLLGVCMIMGVFENHLFLSHKLQSS
jgi:hypothetical protein